MVNINNFDYLFYLDIYPDLKLYEEILFLENYFEGKYCVENVIPYYEPLIYGKKIGRHLYWCNFVLPNDLNERKILIGSNKTTAKTKKRSEARFGFSRPASTKCAKNQLNTSSFCYVGGRFFMIITSIIILIFK